MTTKLENNALCQACGMYYAYTDGLCWQCKQAYDRHAVDFAAAANDSGEMEHSEMGGSHE